MYPVLWKSSGITINSYPVFLGLAALTLVGTAGFLASRREIDYRKSLPILLLLGLGGAGGCAAAELPDQARGLHRQPVPALQPQFLRLLASTADWCWRCWWEAPPASSPGSAYPAWPTPPHPPSDSPSQSCGWGASWPAAVSGKRPRSPGGPAFPCSARPTGPRSGMARPSSSRPPHPVHPTQLYELLAAPLLWNNRLHHLQQKNGPGDRVRRLFPAVLRLPLV